MFDDFGKDLIDFYKVTNNDYDKEHDVVTPEITGETLNGQHLLNILDLLFDIFFFWRH